MPEPLLSREEGFAVAIYCRVLLMRQGHLHFGYVTTNAVCVKFVLEYSVLPTR